MTGTTDTTRLKRVAFVVAAAVVAAALWYTRSWGGDSLSVPSSNYFTGPMRSPAHPDKYVDEQGNVYDKGPDGKFIKRTSSGGFAGGVGGPLGRANVGLK